MPKYLSMKKNVYDGVMIGRKTGDQSIRSYRIKFLLVDEIPQEKDTFEYLIDVIEEECLGSFGLGGVWLTLEIKDLFFDSNYNHSELKSYFTGMIDELFINLRCDLRRIMTSLYWEEERTIINGTDKTLFLSLKYEFLIYNVNTNRLKLEFIPKIKTETTHRFINNIVDETDI